MRIICLASLLVQALFVIHESSADKVEIKQTQRSLKKTKKAKTPQKGPLYEIWASDQSNTGDTSKHTGLGVYGSLLWIWPSEEVEKQIQTQSPAVSTPCTPEALTGPCDILKIFPQTLQEVDRNGYPTGYNLKDLNSFGRMHGIQKDPFDKYVAASIYSPGGGYVGVIDSETKGAVALFRITKVSWTTGDARNTNKRSVHMCFWSTDGSAIIVSNYEGKMIERIDIKRNRDKSITSLYFNLAATLALGTDTIIEATATYFSGNNAYGKPLIGGIMASYDTADLGNLTPLGKCKENGCANAGDGGGGGRPLNYPVCPISVSSGRLYVTLARGGLFVVDSTKTPMKIVGEYGNQVVNGAGCGGVQVNSIIFLNSGVSYANLKESMFAVMSFDDDDFKEEVNNENSPSPNLLYRDANDSPFIGYCKNGGSSCTQQEDPSGQVPGLTTRRDAHGLIVTKDGKFLHVSDRVQNTMEVFEVKTQTWVGKYDYTAGDACGAKAVSDLDQSFPKNDPATDLMSLTPDGKYFVAGLRGPQPVTFPFSGQGSCPGVGLIEVLDGGKTGKLVDVIRTTNTNDKSPAVPISGGSAYTGVERSDIHQALVVLI